MSERSSQFPLYTGPIAAVGALGLTCALTAPLTGNAVAAPATTCTTNVPSIVLEPGLALTKSASGKFRLGKKATVECDGPVKGAAVTGAGDVSKLSGTFKGSCAQGGTGTFTMVFKLPTKDGTVKLVNKGTFTVGALKGGVAGGELTGDTANGTFSVTPTKGNCATEPMSEIRAVHKMRLLG